MVINYRRSISSKKVMGLMASLWSQINIKWQRRLYYSQSQEDQVMASYLLEKNGTYIDVGSGRPISGSNSYHFYKRGWSGLLIDPIWRNEKLSQMLRTRDKFSRSLIGDEGSVTFFETYPYEYSTTSEKVVNDLITDGLAELRKTEVLITRPLSSFGIEMKESEPSFISIDTEGADLRVLKSNNWTLCRPRVICIESSAETNSESAEIIRYLSHHGYQFVKQTPLSKVFLSEKYQNSKVDAKSQLHQ